MVYRFIGNEAVIGNVGLKNIGDAITLSEDSAKDVLVGGGAKTGHAGAAALIPEADFTEVFGAEPVNRYAPGFEEKMAAALAKMHAHRLGLEG